MLRGTSLLVLGLLFVAGCGGGSGGGGGNLPLSGVRGGAPPIVSTTSYITRIEPNVLPHGAAAVHVRIWGGGLRLTNPNGTNGYETTGVLGDVPLPGQYGTPLLNRSTGGADNILLLASDDHVDADIVRDRIPARQMGTPQIVHIFVGVQEAAPPASGPVTFTIEP